LAEEIIIRMEVLAEDPRLVEMMGHAGFDFAHVENEHVAHDWQSVENLTRRLSWQAWHAPLRSEQCFDGPAACKQIIKALKCGAQLIMVLTWIHRRRQRKS
jgi:2-keto-3-deoxy-L-rhamnonate aldolase RhmA